MRRVIAAVAVSVLAAGCGAPPPQRGDAPVCEEARAAQAREDEVIGRVAALPEDQRDAHHDEVAAALGVYRSFGREQAPRADDVELRALLEEAASAGVSAPVGSREAERHFLAMYRVLERCRALGH